MNILHLSDIHFRDDYKKDIINSDYYRLISKMENPINFLDKIINHCLERFKIDVVVITGDLTESGSVCDYNILKEYLLNKFKDKNIILTLGNHDIKENFYKAWGEENRNEKYDEKYFYKDVLYKGKSVFISLDNSKYGYDNGYIDENRLDWLQKEIEKSKGNDIILITHHHLNHEHGNIAPLVNQKLLDIIDNSKIKNILCGHTHHFYEGMLRDKKVFISYSSSFKGDEIENKIVRFSENYGYSVYSLNDGQLECIYKKDFNGKILGDLIF